MEAKKKMAKAPSATRKEPAPDRSGPAPTLPVPLMTKRSWLFDELIVIKSVNGSGKKSFGLNRIVAQSIVPTRRASNTMTVTSAGAAAAALPIDITLDLHTSVLVTTHQRYHLLLSADYYPANGAFPASPLEPWPAQAATAATTTAATAPGLLAVMHGILVHQKAVAPAAQHAVVSFCGPVLEIVRPLPSVTLATVGSSGGTDEKTKTVGSIAPPSTRWHELPSNVYLYLFSSASSPNPAATSDATSTRQKSASSKK